MAAIAVTALVGYIHYSDKLIDQAEQVRVAHTKTELKLSETLLQLEQSIETARETPTIEQVDALEKSLAFANHEIAQLKAASENDEQTRLMSDAVADSKKPAKRGSFTTDMMAEIIGNEELMASQAKMSVGMQYSSLLRDL